jgi:CubicO group peptidase (beta-lactamase class C family)
LAGLILSACTSDKASNDVDSGAVDSGQEEGFDDTALRAAIEADMAEFGLTAAAVAVLRDGKTVWAEGFGTLTPDGSVPVDADTRFRVASVTKSMTAIAMLQQVDAGCFELSDPINDHMRFEMQTAPGMAEDMQIRHLLNHTAGIYDYVLPDDYDGDGHIRPFVDAVQAELPMLAPPGRMFNYSNTNFVVAGRILELCTGGYYRPYMDSSVLEPLGMTRTTFDTETVSSDDNYAMGITRVWPGSEGTDVVIDAESYTGSHLWPGMGAWSSVRDIGRLAEFWMAGDATVLPDALHAEMVSEQADRETGEADVAYGYGLDVRTGVNMSDGHYPAHMVSHGGQLWGYGTFVYTLPELGVGVVVVINREYLFPMRTVEAALDLASFVDPIEDPTPPVDPATFAELAGTYTHDMVMGDFIVSVVDGNLEVDIPSLDADGVPYNPRLTAVRPDNFSFESDGQVYALSFIRDADGKPEYVRSRWYVGKRVDSALAPRVAPVPEAWGNPSRWMH